MARPTPEDAAQRQALFEALTGNAGANVTGTSNDVAGMLRTVYGTTRHGQATVDTREAARRLGVSQRTVQRWIKNENQPSPDHLKALRTRSRQASTTKRGRARALKRALASAPRPQAGVRVEVAGFQGPKDYGRDRLSRQKLNPEEYQELLDAYAAGGDQGALTYLQGIYDEKYVDNWQFGSISSFRVDGLGSSTLRDDPRAL